MRVLLISANTERANMVALPLGMGLVAAATRRAGHEVHCIDLLRASDPTAAVRDAIARTQPRVIGISVRNIDDQNLDSPRFLLEQVKGVVAACRAGSAAPIVLGGAGFSIFPDETLSYLGADYGVAGDGERAFPALLDRLERSDDPRGLPGVHFSGADATAPAHPDALDSLPLWDESLAAVADPADPELWIPVQSRRGCPNDCSYCSTWRIQGRAIRCRSPRLVAETVGRLAAAGFQRFYFVDNSFNIPETHALELCRQLAALATPITWRCILYPHLVREDLVAAMAAAGCVEASLGFESGCPRILREMNKRFLPADVRAASDLLKAHGIRRMGFLLLGGPGETPESVEESLAFAASLSLDSLRVTVGIRIYPGTPLARRALAEGVIASEHALLFPRFYLAPGLEPWIHERVTAGVHVLPN
ncbi:MAG: B12-binding domain-containing radical SAM protein [Thermoanaerobaculales bacterium]